MPLKSSTVEYKFTLKEVEALFKREIAAQHNVRESQIEVYFDVSAGNADRWEYSCASLTSVRVIVKNS